MNKKKLAGLVKLFPSMRALNPAVLKYFGFNAADVYDAAAAGPAPAAGAGVRKAGQMQMVDGGNANLDVGAWSVVMRDALRRWVDSFAPWHAFSFSVSDEFYVPGAPNILPRMNVNIVDNTGEAKMDDYSGYFSRTDNSKATHAEVVLHKFDDVISISPSDLAKGVSPEPLIAAAMSRVANAVQGYFLSELAVGKTQGDDQSTAISAITVPEVGSSESQFNFGYANRHLSEAIQPRVTGMLLNAEYYAALKMANQFDFGPDQLDIDNVAKVLNLSKLGLNAVGLLANQRGAGIGFRPMLMMRGAYDSMEQLTYQGAPMSLTVTTGFDPDNNCMKVIVGTLAGITVTDASAIKPLVTA